MATLLKHFYNAEYINRLSNNLLAHYPKFKAKEFYQSIMTKEWESFELKARMSKITEKLFEYLPKDFKKAVTIILKVAPNFDGYHGIFFPNYIEQYGQNHWDTSINALENLTPYSTSEFAVRSFIQSNPKKMMSIMLKWSKHKNEHVRRLSSEGCRPRLPWAMALPEFKKDPTLILPILENLKSDPSEYVRRSVANNLNDITKDNPHIVLKIATNWYGKNNHTDRLLKHAMRSLLKKGDPKALKIFGLGSIKNLSLKSFKVETPQLKIGQSLLFTFTIHIKNNRASIVRIEYCLYFLKKNGSHNRKVFKISEASLNKTKTFQKKHSFKNLSTRKHHPGIHHIALQINGIEHHKVEFQLK